MQESTNVGVDSAKCTVQNVSTTAGLLPLLVTCVDCHSALHPGAEPQAIPKGWPHHLELELLSLVMGWSLLLVKHARERMFPTQGDFLPFP